MNFENRLRSDKKILFASVLFLMSIVSRIVYVCMMPIVYEGFVYVGSNVGSIISMIPNVLFLIHTLVFYKTEKPQKLFAISYIVLLAFNFIGLLQGTSIIRNILFVLSHGLMVCISLRGTKSRKWSLVGIIIPCVLVVISFIQMFGYVSSAISHWGFGYLWMNISSHVSNFSLYAALFIIVPDTIKIKNDVELTSSHLLEEQLVTLKQQYDSGKITEQEYNDKKKELLNNL